PAEDLSRRSVEGFLQDALFAALDIQSRSSVSFDERLRSVLDHLLTLLKAPAQKYRCWIPVDGLALDVRSARFGDVRFARFGRHQLRWLTMHRPVRGRGAGWRQLLKWLRESNLWDSTCAIVDVEARVDA